MVRMKLNNSYTDLQMDENRSFERRICAQTQDLQIFKKFNMSQMNPKEDNHNTAYSLQLPHIACHSL